MVKNMLLVLMPIWLKSQVTLSKVRRWGGYSELGPEMRPQNVLEHTISVMTIVSILVKQLRVFNPQLDTELILDAFLWHDQPEGYLEGKRNGYDVSYIHKKNLDDVEEYLAFQTNVLDHLQFSSELKSEIAKAYLLQYAEKDTEIFPESAQDILVNLKENYRLESLCFAALESFEYIYYALECDDNQSHPYILTWVLRKQLPRLQKYKEQIPGFAEVVLTTNLEEYFLSVLEKNKEVEEQ